VLRPGSALQDHPGWHLFLEALHSGFGWDARQLVIASTVLLFLLFTLPPLVSLERGESWTAALLLLAVTNTPGFLRLLLGRPYLVSMAALLVLLLCLPSLGRPRLPRAVMALAVLSTALAAWLHGQWYLFALPLGACLAARKWRASRRLFTSIAAGTLIGALLTGRPLEFLRENVFHAYAAFDRVPDAALRVSEFQPFAGYPVFPVLAAALFLWRRTGGRWRRETFDSPVFFLACAGYALGFYSGRFWYDWGMPAFCLWMALEFQELSRSVTGRCGRLRLLISLAAGIALFLVATDNRDHRFDVMAGKRLSMGDPDHLPWLPGEGGTVYSSHMAVFYRTFFENPRGPWRYALGFEPAMMTEGNLEIYREILRSGGDPSSFRPWVEAMGPPDRIILWHPFDSAPDIPGLRWHRPTGELWAGKLPSAGDQSPPPPTLR